jgi:hypothetical protein
MPDRVEKQKRNSTVSRHNLLALFDEFGFDAMPCSRCSGEGIPCRWLPDDRSKTKKCKACSKAGVKCDGTGRPMSKGDFLEGLCGILDLADAS